MNSKIKNILEWIYCVIIAVVIALTVKYFIGTPTIVKQTSMKDTLIEGERLWLNRWARTVNGNYKIGDIVTFEAPSTVYPSLEQINYDCPIAIYEYTPNSMWAKFTYYVLETNKTSYIKRIIGVEGDHIKIENGKVYRNNQELEETYLSEGVITEERIYTDIVVPEGCLFLLGDNREHSTDSRDFGCIPIDKVESKVAFRFWPLNKFGKIE